MNLIVPVATELTDICWWGDKNVSGSDVWHHRPCLVAISTERNRKVFNNVVKLFVFILLWQKRRLLWWERNWRSRSLKCDAGSHRAQMSCCFLFSRWRPDGADDLARSKDNVASLRGLCFHLRHRQNFLSLPVELTSVVPKEAAGWFVNCTLCSLVLTFCWTTRESVSVAPEFSIAPIYFICPKMAHETCLSFSYVFSTAEERQLKVGSGKGRQHISSEDSV